MCFCAGAGIELFMIKTGFYEVVTRIEADRQYEQAQLLEEKKRQRMIDQAMNDVTKDNGK